MIVMAIETELLPQHKQEKMVAIGAREANDFHSVLS